MADTQKPGRGKPLPERFEFFEADPTAHLTEEQKKWKVVKLRPAREHIAVLEKQSIFVLKLHLQEQVPDSDQIVLAANIVALVQVLSLADRELGGGGLVLVDQRAEPGAVILSLKHANAEGATERQLKLAQLVNNAVEAKIDPDAGVLKLLDVAARSSVGQVQLLLAASRNVSRSEVLAAV